MWGHMRTTIQVDEALAERVRRLVPIRRFNRFVNEALAEKVAALEQRELEQELREGYLATREDRVQLNADWHVVDVESWPE